MTSSAIDINTLLSRWNKAKQEKQVIDQKIERYKRAIEKIMLRENTNIIHGDNFIVKKRQQSRDTLTQQDLPEDLWKKYARRIKYNAYYLTEK